MLKKSLNKLSENQLHTLSVYSNLIDRAKVNKNVKEFEWNAGRLRGYLECLYQLEVITSEELESIYLWFFEQNRMETEE